MIGVGVIMVCDRNAARGITAQGQGVLSVTALYILVGPLLVVDVNIAQSGGTCKSIIVDNDLGNKGVADAGSEGKSTGAVVEE